MGEPSFDILSFDTKQIQITKQLGPITFIGKLNSKSFPNSVFRFSQKQNASNIQPIDFFEGISNISDLWAPSLVPISYACYSKDRQQFIIVSKMFRNGNLSAYIESDQHRKQWSQTIGAKTIIGLAHAIRQIHQRGVAHRSIQPTKILFDEKMNPHLIDIWLSESPPDVRYMPPEMMGASEADPKAADIFAFGLIYYHIASGISPFEGIYEANIGPYFFSGQRPTIPSNVSRFSKNLINQCWHHDPKQRPTADELYTSILEHYNEIVMDVKYDILTDYVKMLVKYPATVFLSRKGESKACQKMANYLKDMDITLAAQHYLEISKTYQISAAPTKTRGQGRGPVNQTKNRDIQQEQEKEEEPDTMDQPLGGQLEEPEPKELPKMDMPEPLVPEDIPIPQALQIGGNIMQPMGQPIPIPAGQVIMQPIMINGQIMMQPMMIQQNAPIPKSQKSSKSSKSKKKSNASKAQSSISNQKIPYYDINKQMEQMRQQQIREEGRQQIELLKLENERLKMEQMEREKERKRIENERLMKKKQEAENQARIQALVKENQERNARERELQRQFIEQHQSAIREALFTGKKPANVLDTPTFDSFTSDSTLSFSSISRDGATKYNLMDLLNKKSKKKSKPKKKISSSSRQSGNTTDTIFEAAEKGDMNDLRRFIEEDGIDPNLQDTFRSTALHLACENGHSDAAYYLIKHGADVTRTDKWKKTPLHWGAQNGHLQILKILVASGADINAQDKWNYTPLHLAAEKNKAEAVVYLLAAGANPSLVNESGKKPADLAVEPAIKEIFNQAGIH